MGVEIEWTTGGEGGFGPTFGAVSAGQLLLLYAFGQSGDPYFTSGSDGWDLLLYGQVDAGSPPFTPASYCAIWQKIAGASESPPGLDCKSWLVQALSGWDSSLTRTSQLGTYETSSTTFLAPSIVIDAAGIAVHGVMSDSLAVFSAPEGQEIIGSANSGGNGQILLSSTGAVPSSTPSGQWTSSPATKGRAMTIAIPALADVSGGRNKCLGLFTHFCPL